MLRLIAALALSPLLLAGCGADDSGRRPVRLDAVLSRDSAAEARLDAALRAALEQSTWFSPRSLELGGALRAGALLEREEASGRWVLHLDLEVPPDLRPRFAATSISSATAVAAEDGAPSLEALAGAAARAVFGLEAQCRLASGELRALDDLLASDDPEHLLLALRWVRDRADAARADAVATLLGHRDSRVSLAAVEVLGEVGGPDHAGAVVRRVQLMDPRATREAYRALAQLGGPDAVGFLGFAAANEDDPELRREAERALSAAMSGRRPGPAEVARGVDLPKVARGHRQ